MNYAWQVSVLCGQITETFGYLHTTLSPSATRPVNHSVVIIFMPTLSLKPKLKTRLRITDIFIGVIKQFLVLIIIIIIMGQKTSQNLIM